MIHVASLSITGPYDRSLGASTLHNRRSLRRTTHNSPTSHVFAGPTPCPLNDATTILRTWPSNRNMVEDCQLATACGRAIRYELGSLRRSMDWRDTNTTRLGQRMAEMACHHCDGPVYWRGGWEADRRILVQGSEDKDIIERTMLAAHARCRCHFHRKILSLENLSLLECFKQFTFNIRLHIVKNIKTSPASGASPVRQDVVQLTKFLMNAHALDSISTSLSTVQGIVFSEIVTVRCATFWISQSPLSLLLRSRRS